MNTRRALIAAAVLFALAALSGVVALLFPSNTLAMRVFGTAMIFGGLAIFALGAAIVIEKGRVVPLMYAAMVSAALAFILWSLMVWDIVRSYDTDTARVAGTLTTLSIVLPIIGLLMLPRLTMPIARWTRIVTILSLCISALIINAGFWDLLDSVPEEVLVRVMGIASVLAAAGIICTPILYKVQSIRREEAALRPIPIHVACPRCAKGFEARQGASNCSHCGLRFTIKVEEPRCTCGYPLYGLESDKCPECGREISESDRWLPPMSKAHEKTPDPADRALSES